MFDPLSPTHFSTEGIPFFMFSILFLGTCILKAALNPTGPAWATESETGRLCKALSL
jgi:hypothetical protein